MPNMKKTTGTVFSQAVRALPKGARGAAVSAMAKAKPKPTTSAKPKVTPKPKPKPKVPKMTPQDAAMKKILEKKNGKIYG